MENNTENKLISFLKKKEEINENEKKKINYFVIEDPNLGVRKTMEDFTIVIEDIIGDGLYSFFCVLDGHGGDKVAKYIKKEYPKLLKMKLQTYKKAYKIENIIKMTIENIENKLRSLGERECGTTFCGILADKKKNIYYTINIGDSQISTIFWNKNQESISSVFLTEVHKTSNAKELERVNKNGGTIINDRVGGNLMITRSIGDFDLKKYGIISDPDFLQFSFDKKRLIFIASDGIWDFVNEKVVKDFVRDYDDIEVIARKLVRFAIDKGSLDNISLIVLSF